MNTSSRAQLYQVNPSAVALEVLLRVERRARALATVAGIRYVDPPVRPTILPIYVDMARLTHFAQFGEMQAADDSGIAPIAGVEETTRRVLLNLYECPALEKDALTDWIALTRLTPPGPELFALVMTAVRARLVLRWGSPLTRDELAVFIGCSGPELARVAGMAIWTAPSDARAWLRANQIPGFQ